MEVNNKVSQKTLFSNFDPRGIFSRALRSYESIGTKEIALGHLEQLYVTFNFSGHPVIKVEKKFRRR